MSETELKNAGRSHEPNLRELTAQLDDLGQLVDTRFRYVERLMDERDRLYGERITAQSTAVTAALQAVKEHTSTSFAASEKAITKAEEAQREYNIRSNEFRGQLDDQAKLLMPRTEVQTLIKAVEDKLEDLKKRLEIIAEFRVGAVAKEENKQGTQLQHNWGVGIAVAIFFGGISMVLSIAGLVLAVRK